jgi:DNA modification methylase/transcriptional regulator with XRE-family HTH domain
VSVRILVGDAREVLAMLPAESVHCVVTSPPYWGLRDYGLPPTVWGGEDLGCAHAWGEPLPGRNGNPNTGLAGTGTGAPETRIPGLAARGAGTETSGAFCARCGAWRGALGLEPTPEAYVAHLVEVFRAVRRVLRDDGTCWVNLGDSYAGNGPGSWGSSDKSTLTTASRNGAWAPGKTIGTTPPRDSGLKPKDLVGIPWRVAFALQADGWWLRSEIIWAKPNPMPESVTDRPTKAHESLFLLAKAERYFFDADAIRECYSPMTIDTPQRRRMIADGKFSGEDEYRFTDGYKGERMLKLNDAGRNKRSVWTIPSEPFPLAHFATFPPALVEPCVQAGTSARGACPACGAPWARVGKIPQSVIGDAVRHAREQAGLSREALAARLGIYVGNIWNWELGGCLPRTAKWDDLMAALGLTFSREAFIERAEYLVTGRQAGPKQQAAADDPFVNRPYAERMVRLPRAVAEWAPTCACGPDPVPCVVLDPFAGAGTVGLVADRLGRDAILIELKPEYAAMAERRIREEAPLLTAVAVEGAALPDAPAEPSAKSVMTPRRDGARWYQPDGLGELRYPPARAAASDNGDAALAPEQLALDWSEIARVDV